MRFSYHNAEISKLPRAAAVQWAIMKPELRPPSWTRNAGSSLYAKKNFIIEWIDIITKKIRINKFS